MTWFDWVVVVVFALFMYYKNICQPTLTLIEQKFLKIFLNNNKSHGQIMSNLYKNNNKITLNGIDKFLSFHTNISLNGTYLYSFSLAKTDHADNTFSYCILTHYEKEWSILAKNIEILEQSDLMFLVLYVLIVIGLK